MLSWPNGNVVCFAVYKRSTDEVTQQWQLYSHLGFFSWKKSQNGNHIFKIDVYREQELASPTV